MADKVMNPYKVGTKAHAQWREGYMLGLGGTKRIWSPFQSAEFKAGNEVGLRVNRELAPPSPRVAD